MGSESILKYVSGWEWKYDLEILREEILQKYIYSAHTLSMMFTRGLNFTKTC